MNRFNPQQMSPTAAGREMILAAINVEGGNGEYLYLAVDTPSDGTKDDAGRMMGFIMASTKGDKEYKQHINVIIKIQVSKPLKEVHLNVSHSVGTISVLL